MCDDVVESARRMQELQDCVCLAVALHTGIACHPMMRLHGNWYPDEAHIFKGRSYKSLQHACIQEPE